MYQANNQRKVQPPPSITQNETEARAKLAQYVYEYLCQNGAPKAAESFKSEVPTLSEMSQINLNNDGNGFLYNWFSVFWDLYSATPDRQEKGNSTLEAKAFVDMFHNYGGSGMNGGQFPSGPPSMNVPPQMDPSMMGNFYRPPQPNVGVGPSSQSSPIPGYQNSFGNAPPRFSHPMPPRMPQMGPNSFVNAPVYPPNDPRMMVPNNRMPPNCPRSLIPNMRPVRPGMYGHGPPFMDSPTTPTFPPQGMMQNGVPMNGPGIPPMMAGMPPNNPNNYDPQMMMNPQFSMMCDPTGSGTPNSSAGPTSGAPHSVPPPNNIGGPSSVGSVGHGNMPASVSAENHQLAASSSLSNLLNGNDMNMELKQSPSSVLNGGTPAQQQNNGPGSATGIAGPASVHSQGAPHSINAVNPNNPQLQSTPQSHAQMTPTSGADNILYDYQQNADNPDGENDGNKDAEIAKIKSSLIEGFS